MITDQIRFHAFPFGPITYYTEIAQRSTLYLGLVVQVMTKSSTSFDPLPSGCRALHEWNLKPRNNSTAYCHNNNIPATLPNQEITFISHLQFLAPASTIVPFFFFFAVSRLPEMWTLIKLLDWVALLWYLDATCLLHSSCKLSWLPL